MTIALIMLLVGCQAGPDRGPHTTHRGSSPTGDLRHAETVVVYFYREASYKGLGRIHELKVDSKTIGPLTSDNYYRMELWPGDYQFTVHRPAENFFGAHSPPENTGMRLSFVRNDGTGIFVYKYVDGSGIHRIEPVDNAMIARIEHARMASGTLSARDTAQVKFLHDARYDGPAKFGKAHGKGTLTWDDGSILHARFEYGEATADGEFFSTTGKIYLGQKRKGRPVGPGVWLDSQRRILYAGNFKDELPHGVGMRSGEEIPEFCVYDNGEDITKTLWQLAQQAVEEEDREIREENTVGLEANTEKAIEEPAADSKGAPQQADQEEEALMSLVDISFDTSAETPDPGQGSAITGVKRRRSDSEAKPTRDERISAKYTMIKQSLAQQIEEKRLWCLEEFDLGRRLCECAPFAPNFEHWNGCISR